MSSRRGRRSAIPSGILCLLLAPCMLLAPILLRAQTISSIQPDVGAPGTSVLIEIIGPNSTIGNFGVDGLYMNGKGDRVRVTTADPEDSLRIVVGPVLVSWQGRMITTHIFPLAHNHPDHHDWRKLDEEYVIRLHVIVDGKSSNPVNFSIVRPHPHIDLQGGDVLGEGGRGIRSPSGAFVFASLNILNSRIRVSTQDSDSSREGNQGYLPVHIQVIGSMRGSGGAVLSVDAEGVDGGPGGGGGGGLFCRGGGRGGNGGNGYSGGGGGGRDAAGDPTVQSMRKHPGMGTGPKINENGSAANGLMGGSTPEFRNAGGGSGHPFGASGAGCLSTATCTPGGFGGGGGTSSLGGNGAYAHNAPSFGGLGGGRAHGNVHLQPLAGGSGGASGTPATVGECGGYGGGGGGALQISALRMEGIAFSASGAAGQNGANAGGCGSGGGIILSSRQGISTSSIQTRGGNGDSLTAGRVRIDGPLLSTPGRAAGASYYRGPSIDSTQWISLSGFTVRGTGNGERIRLYIRTKNTPWSQIAQVLSYENGAWEIQLELQDSGQQHFLVVMQDVRKPVADLHRYDPHLVMSATGANVLYRSDAHALLDLDPKLDFPPVACATYRDSSIAVRNSSDEQAALFQPAFTDGRYFSVVAPSTWPLVISPGSTEEIHLRFHNATAPRGILRDTLLLPTDDLTVSGQLHRIPVSARAMEALLLPEPTELRHPKLQLCADSTLQWSVDLDNSGNVPVSIAHLKVAQDPALVSIAAPAGLPLTLQPGEHATLQVRVTLPFGRTSLLDTLWIESEALDCRLSLAVPISLAAESIALDYTDTMDFGAVHPSDFPLRRSISVANTGAFPISIREWSMEGQGCFSVDTLFPLVIPPGVQMQLPVLFHDPGLDGPCVASSSLSTDPACVGGAISIRGARVTPVLRLKLPSVQAAPGERVELPVIISSQAQFLRVIDDTLRFQLHVDASMLYPISTDGGSLTGEERVLDVELPIRLSSGGDTLTRLSFLAMLGRSEQCGFTIVDAHVTSGLYAVETETGMFTLDEVCRQGGTRLFDAQERLAIAGNYPNPFNSSTVIRCTLIERGHHRLTVMDSRGAIVATLQNGVLEPGSYEYYFDATRLPSGIYSILLTTPTQHRRRSMMMVK